MNSFRAFRRAFLRACFCALFTSLLTACGRAEPRVLRDLPYVSGGHARQVLDLYLPEQPKGPLLVYIHGGAWRSGSKDRPPGLALVKQGYTIASIEYRFSQDAPFPAQIEDCKAAIRWLRAHAAEYGYDPQRIGAWGMSAGGHLVALLAATGHVRDFDVGENLAQSSAIACGIDWFGPADFLAFQPPSGEPMVQLRGAASALVQLFGGTMEEKPELARRASPVTWVTKETAPLLILHGTADPLVPLNQSERLVEKMRAAGAEVTLEVIEGAGHGSREFTTPKRLLLMADFLKRHLER